MGLANLVPGISGGTMLLAAGVYPGFIQAIAEITTLRFRAASVVLLGAVVLSAAIAILLFAGVIKGLVVDHRWVMYSLFIGLTLGGIPVIWAMVRPATRATWAGAAAGCAAMAALAVVQQTGWGGGSFGAGGFMLFLAGVAGASAMILPGVSGGYLLLVLGQYVPILSAIDAFKVAAQSRGWADAFEIGFSVGLPVGLGVVVGIVGVSNVLRFLLARHEKATLGVLLGLLVGAVAGLWPFQEGVEPAVGDVLKGRAVTAERLAELDPEDYPTRYFRPDVATAGGAAALILAGFACTAGIARFGTGDAGSAPEL